MDNVIEKDHSMKLIKGPGETFTSELLFSENIDIHDLGESAEPLSCDFGMKAYISNSQSLPDHKT
jgi:hypothetical protein